MKDKNGIQIDIGDTVKIDRYEEPLIGEVKELDGGQIYIDHKYVNLKYMYQCHCEVCDEGTFPFFINFFEPYELQVI